MRFEISNRQRAGFNEVKTIHGNQEILWRTKAFEKVRLLGDPFNEINRFLDTLPDKVQDTLFGIYERINDDFEHIVDNDVLYTQLSKSLKKIFTYIKLENIKNWILMVPSYRIPDMVEGSSDIFKNIPPELTYQSEEYTDLVALSLATRFLIPIWGVYHQILEESNAMFIALDLTGILEETELAHCEAYQRLGVYCTAFQKTYMDSYDALDQIFRGLASTEIPRWLQAMTMFRRLTIFPILDLPPELVDKRTLVTSVYYYVKSEVQPNKKSVAEKTRERIFSEPKGGMEDKKSFLEYFRIKKKTAEGDFIAIELFTENPHNLINLIDKTTPPEIINECIDGVQRMKQTPIHTHQLILTQWILSYVLTPKSIVRLNRNARLSAIATAQAVLWHWGFHDIAVMMTVDREWTTSDTNPQLDAPPTVKPRLTRDNHEQLSTLYPFERRPASKKDGVPNHNFAVAEIDMIVKSLHLYRWLYLGSTELLKKTNQSRGRRPLVLPMELRKQLTDLAIKIGKDHQ